MQNHRRTLLASSLALLVALVTACGGEDPAAQAATLDGTPAADAAFARKAGGSTATVAMSVAPNPVALNGSTTISLYPGSLKGQQLFINWQCTKDGVSVASGRSWELNYAVGNETGYAWVNDHFEWTFTVYGSSVFTSGPASCVAKGLLYTAKNGYTSVGQATFSVQ